MDMAFVAAEAVGGGELGFAAGAPTLVLLDVGVAALYVLVEVALLGELLVAVHALVSALAEMDVLQVLGEVALEPEALRTPTAAVRLFRGAGGRHVGGRRVGIVVEQVRDAQLVRACCIAAHRAWMARCERVGATLCSDSSGWAVRTRGDVDQRAPVGDP